MNQQTPTWVRGEEYFISEYTSLNRLCIKWQLQETKLQHAWSIAYKMSINLRCWMKIFIQYTYLHVHVLERRGGLYYVILHRKLYLHVQNGTSYIHYLQVLVNILIVLHEFYRYMYCISITKYPQIKRFEPCVFSFGKGGGVGFLLK